jgi:hypothetical protein
VPASTDAPPSGLRRAGITAEQRPGLEDRLLDVVVQASGGQRIELTAEQADVLEQEVVLGSVKWLKRIDVLTEPHAGEFRTGHYMYEWPDRAPESVDLMRVRARITDPSSASVIAGPCTVRGKAWSGTGPVTRVEVSLTGEDQWHEAQVQASRGPYQWQDWSFDWDATWDSTPSAPGHPTRRETYNPRCRPGTGSATGTMPSK